MDSYRRKIKLRMVWWFTWWAIVVLFSILYVFNVIDGFIHLDMIDKYYLPISLFWMIIFGAIAIIKAPRIDRLLQRDIKVNPENIFAKAMMLERRVRQQNKKAEDNMKKEELERRVKEMEETVGGQSKQ